MIMWNYHSTLQCNVANYIVNRVYFGNKTTNPGTCARTLALEMISLTSNDLKVSTKTKAAQMGNLGFGVGLEILTGCHVCTNHMRRINTPAECRTTTPPCRQSPT